MRKTGPEMIGQMLVRIRPTVLATQRRKVLPIVNYTCEGSNTDPEEENVCPVCKKPQRVYVDREGRKTIYPHRDL